jgi:hypothetical protein
MTVGLCEHLWGLSSLALALAPLPDTRLALASLIASDIFRQESSRKRIEIAAQKMLFINLGSLSARQIIEAMVIVFLFTPRRRLIAVGIIAAVGFLLLALWSSWLPFPALF